MNPLLWLRIWLWRLQRAQFYRDLADAFSRHMALREFLQQAIRNAKTLNDGSAQIALKEMLDRLSRGHSTGLTDTLRGVAPKGDYLMLSAVEQAPAAKKGEACLAIADAVQFKQTIAKMALIGCLVPILVALITGFICVLTASAIQSIAASNDSPKIWFGFNGTVRTVADAILAYWPQALTVTIVVLALLIWQAPRLTGALRLRLDGLPIIGAYRDYQGAVVLTTLSVLLANGTAMTDAIASMRKNATPWLRWHLGRINQSLLDKPQDYTLAITRGLFSRRVQARVAMLMTTSNFSAALIRIGREEVSTLQEHLETAIKVGSDFITYSFAAVAVYLSVGLMTISNSLHKQATEFNLPTTQVVIPLSVT